MGIEALISKEKPQNQKLVAVKLKPFLVSQIQAIRKKTGKTNAEIYSALLSEGLSAYNTAVNGNRRGRPSKASAKKKAKKRTKA